MAASVALQASVYRSLHDAANVLKQLLSTASPTTKGLGIVLCLNCLVGVLVPSAARHLALIPERTLPWKPTNVLTCGYFPYGTGRVAIATTMVDIIALMHFGKLVEPVWGSVEFLRYVVVVNALCGIGTWAAMYVLYVFTLNNFFLFASFGGFHGAVAGLFVATKQVLPEDEPFASVPGLSGLKMRHKHLPFLYGCATLLLCLLHGAQYHHIGLSLFVAFGTFGGWAYLRYFQQLNNLPPGDASDEFAFSTLFPPPLDRFVDLVAELVTSIVQRGRGSTSADSSVSSSTDAVVEAAPTLPPNDPHNRLPGETDDAFQRRLERLQRAEKILAERTRTPSAV
ncbi:hypothetical protein PPROV_000718700 [Pycnococcus provasolii]|uniref:Peptidase S54 rhomboid domain-containing protein n=1 Tax=Pycnococcus provasolii TaxID=41880 RepID=A0A830HNE7_9CHLO|nr:hypothetical protein PPROV_000718700 [Pycnococcus provasolii]